MSFEGPPEGPISGTLVLWGEAGEETPLGGPDRNPWCLQGTEEMDPGSS